MSEKLNIYWNKVKAALGKTSKKAWIIAAVALVLVAAAITIFLNSQPYSVLFTGLSGEEASAIMSYLDEQGFRDYRLESGDTILVPKGQESNLKARLLMEGYPKSGFGYSTYYDHVGSLSTESERNRAWLMTVQDRMGAVIRSLDGVKDAVVGISQGENRSYVLDSGNVTGASAYVMVTMNSGRKLTNQQASAIRNLVSRGVQGLQMDQITISDNMGNQYNTAGDTADSDASALKLRLEEENSNKIRTQIMQVLSPLFGEQHVKVAVNCVVDVSNIVTDSTNTYLPDWAADGSTNGAGIIGSRVYSYTFYTDDNTIAGGLVGTTSGSDLPLYVEQEPGVDGKPGKVSGSGQIDYDNPRDTVHKVSTAGYLTDCTVSVSIDSKTAGNVDVESIRSHVARAAGINAVETQTLTAESYLAGKISVLSVPFYQEESVVPIGPDAVIPMWVTYAAVGGLLLFILLLVLIFAIRKKSGKKHGLTDPQHAMEELLAAAGIPQAELMGADVMSLQTEKSMELRRDIRQFADDNPEIAAQMVRSWLKGGDEDG